MTTDLTLSTTNLTGKRLKDCTDQELWDLLETRGRVIKKLPQIEFSSSIIETPDWFSYALTNGVFYIKISGGNEEQSKPADLHLPLKDYEWITVELWDYREETEEMKMAPSQDGINYKMPDGSDFFISISFQVWPHLAIDPRYDKRFEGQEWTNSFSHSGMGYAGQMSPTQFGEVVRYLDTISGMKAFW